MAIAGAVLLAVLLTWPTLQHPLTTIPHDVSDPTLQAWQLAWDGYALKHHPLGIWQANAFYPEHYPLAFSDSLLGYAPFSAIGSGPAVAVLRYNLIYVSTFALATLGAYALVRQFGATRLGAAVAGVAFGFSPWRFSHAGHLNILSEGGIALALAMLARGHGWSLTAGYLPDRVRPRWALAGWLVAGWQVSLGFSLGLPFVYVLILIGLIGALGCLIRRCRLPARLLAADLTGGLLFSAVTLVMVHPYLKVLQQHSDSRRTVAWLKVFSAPVRGFFIADPDSWLWGAKQAAERQTLGWPPEMTLLPGFVLITLGIVGVLISVWSLRARLLLAFSVLASAWLALGNTTPGHGKYGYLLLLNRLPGFESSRTPGRLVLWTILLLSVLAAGAVSAAQQDLAHWLTGSANGSLPRHARPNAGRRATSILWQALLLVPLLAVVAEGISHPKHPLVPRSPIALNQFADPIMVLPTDESFDQQVMLWSTAGFPRLVNGSSGYNPPEQAELRQTMISFPDQSSVQALRAIGVRSVVVIRNEAADSPYLKAMTVAGTDLGLTRTDLKDAVVFSLWPGPASGA